VIAVLRRAGYSKAVFYQEGETFRRCSQSGFQAWKSWLVTDQATPPNIPIIAVKPVWGADHTCEDLDDCEAQYVKALEAYRDALTHEGLTVIYSRDKETLYVSTV